MIVMEQLRQVLTETREASATFAEVAVKFGSGENVIRKFERGETAPRYGSIDAFVGAYADAAGVSPFDLWSAAIDRAAEAEAKLKRGVGPTAPAGIEGSDEERAKRATQAAKTAREATEKARRKSGDKPVPRTKKSQAG